MERSKDRAVALFNRVPRNIRDVPLIEALIGVNETDLLEAIFNVDVDEEHLEPLFSPDEDFFDRAHILTQQSDPGRSKAASAVGNGKEPASAPRLLNPDGLGVPSSLPPPGGAPRSPATVSGSGGGAAPAGNETGPKRLRKRSQTPATRPPSVGQPLMTYDEENNLQSPLARLFSSAVRRPPRPIDYAPSHVAVEEALIGIRRLEGMMEGLKEDKGTVNKLRSDMKELQVRSGDLARPCEQPFVALLTALLSTLRNDRRVSKLSS